jgi:hypothetical protein
MILTLSRIMSLIQWNPLDKSPAPATAEKAVAGRRSEDAGPGRASANKRFSGRPA